MNIQIDNIKKEFKVFLEQFDQIEFAMFFGSCLTYKFTDMSDIDVAIYADELFDILTLGKIISRMEVISGRKIDLIELNNLYKKNPLLTFNIISGSEFIFVKNREKLVDFKRKSYLNYLDTTLVREKFRQNFITRIENKKFGKRNYA